MKNKKEQGKTLQYQLITRFSLIMLGLVLLVNILILSVTALQLYESSKKETEAIEDAFSQVETQTNQEWKNTLQLYIAADDPRYYIRVSLQKSNTVYSSEAYQLYDNFQELKQLPFLSDILWDENTPYFFKQFQVKNTSVAVLTSMEDNFEILATLSLWSLGISALILLLGIFFISRFAKKISAPLVKMNHEVQNLSQQPQVDEQLSEPSSPQEASNLAKSFNRLLQQQEQSMQRERQFISDASHELKTPLAAIRGHVNLIKRRVNEHPEVLEKSLPFIDKESQRMELLTNQLLILDREKQPGEVQEILLAPMIRSTLEEYASLMTQELRLELDEKASLISNREQFYQIIRNLIENAVKYAPADGEISITLTTDEKRISLQVANTGVSIPDNEKEKIFERFYRVDRSRSSKIPGTGIGLAIVKQLTELYHGSISVTDHQPSGVCFTLMFPR